MRPEELEPLQTRDAATESELAELIGREFAVIGERLRRVDGTGKVTGHTLYADDLTFPGMLHANILRSPHPHARIVSIDTSKAEALAGVHAVVTGADTPSRAPSSRGRATRRRCASTRCGSSATASRRSRRSMRTRPSTRSS